MQFDFAECIIQSIKTPLVILHVDFRVMFANDAFYRDYRVRSGEIENYPFLEIGESQWNLQKLRLALEKARDEDLSNAAIELDGFLGGHHRTVCIELRSMDSSDGKFIVLVIDDITRRKQSNGVSFTEYERLRIDVEAGTAELRKAAQMLESETLGREQVQTALHASENALLRSREELRHLSASLMNAQDEERRRVSRELHDDLSQKVAKLQFDIERLEQEVPFSNVHEAKTRMRGVASQAADLSNDLRRVAHQLHPATLDHLGLAVALRSYAEEFSQSTAIPVHFAAFYVPREIPLAIASGLYRIAQEALRNVGKHAGESRVEIVLSRDPKGLALFVRDYGQGFDMESARAKGGLGLISMEERVRLLGGNLSIETWPGRGVLISIQCPLPLEHS